MKQMTTSSILLSMTLSFAPHLSAQTTAPAPLPPQLAAAKTVFISNAIEAEGHYSETAYDQVYAAVQTLNRFTFVDSPQQADLILQFGVPLNNSLVRTLRIIDPKNNVLLWSVSEDIAPAARTSTAEKNLQTAINNLATDLQTICAPQPPATH
jgi:hypothetical protein